MDTDTLLRKMLEQLDASLPRIDTLDAYYQGRQPLAYLSPEAREALSNRLQMISTGIPRLAVTSLAERLRVTGFRTSGTPDDVLWAHWRRCDLDQLSGVAHREALAVGLAHVVVWGDEAGRPAVSVESARQVTTLRDPGTRETIAALKRWETPTTTELVLFEPDVVTHLRADHVDAVTGWRVVERLDNFLGEVPVTTLRNGDRLLDDGVSEMADLLPLVDALNKTLADMLVGSEYYARPRRWATGIELPEDLAGDPVNPFTEGVKMMIAENPDARFGSLPAADLTSYEAAVRVLIGQIMAVSSLPSHYLGVLTSQPASADALRASEASLTAKAEARQAAFGRAWERVARQMLAVEVGDEPHHHDVSVTWADPATRSAAQDADAVTKLYTAGLLPADYALARLGYSDDEVATIRRARGAQQLAAEDVAARVALAERLQTDHGLTQPAALAAAGLFAAANETRNDTKETA